MRPEIIHDWPRRLSDAAQIQRETIIPRVDLYGVPPDAGLVLGIECAFNEERRRVYCAASLMRFPGFTEIERSLAEYDTPFPHTPELESFREGKVICLALEKIQAKPDILMIHGEGINSPAGAGVATHMGVIFDLPSIGCLRRFRGEMRPRVPREKGSVKKILRGTREIATALRSKADVKPIYISPGFRINLDDSLRLTLSMLRGFRAPEPIRVPHLLVTRYKSSATKSAAHT